jgi:hypothetical protein
VAYYMNRGYTLLATGRDLQAVSDFQRVLELSDDVRMREDASRKLRSFRDNQKQ